MRRENGRSGRRSLALGLLLGPGLGLGFGLGGADAARAQEPAAAEAVAPHPAADTGADSAWAAGFAAGDSVAAETPVSGAAARIIAGIAGGVLLAPGAVLTLGGHPEALLPGAGVAALGAEASPTAVPGPPDSVRIQAPGYHAGFEAGFREREARRRRLMTWGAAGASAAATFTFLLLLFTSGGYT